jgi:predicted nucleic acid-binding protein
MGRAVKYLLDSVILIDHFNGIEAATAFMAEHGGNGAISAITHAEVLAGFSVRTERLARGLLDRFRTLPVTTDVADLAASLRRKEHWKLPDALQAALAIRHELTLVTRNTRDFSNSRKMPVLMPYRV